MMPRTNHRRTGQNRAVYSKILQNKEGTQVSLNDHLTLGLYPSDFVGEMIANLYR